MKRKIRKSRKLDFIFLNSPPTPNSTETMPYCQTQLCSAYRLRFISITKKYLISSQNSQQTLSNKLKYIHWIFDSYLKSQNYFHLYLCFFLYVDLIISAWYLKIPGSMPTDSSVLKSFITRKKTFLYQQLK